MFPPAEQILAFIKRQPELVRGALYFSVVQGFYELIYDQDALALFHDNQEETARHLVTGVGPLAASARCAQVIGALDYYFATNREAHEQFQANWPETDSLPILAQVKRQAGLSRRYNDRAAAEWASLRQTSLSFEALHEANAVVVAAHIVPPESII
jgi:hypothetical protein